MCHDKYGWDEHCGTPFEKWNIHCCLCYECGKPQGKSTKHRPWHCRKYPTPQKKRERLNEKYRCMECGSECYHNREHHVCETNLIEEYNYRACGLCGSDRHSHLTCPDPQFDYERIDNRQVKPCRKCGSYKHAFWTCDGKPHPGSQFKNSNVPNESKDHQKLASAIQNPKVPELSTLKQQNDTNVVESLNITNKSSNEHEICTTMKDEFKLVNLKIAAMHSNLNEKIEVLKSTVNKEESLKDNIIKEHKLTIKQLKKNLYDKNEEMKEATLNWGWEVL